MKNLVTSIALMSVFAVSNAQTTAPNFTATDCKGNSHTLFTELNSGKIIVLVWVMPCSMCDGGGKAAYTAVQSFATSHPGKVLYYLIDDAGNTSCSALATWAATNSIDTTKINATFGNTGGTIAESGFGGSGMPHIVVVGGTDHKIYFNEKNGNGSGTQGAIQNAINLTTGIAQIGNEISFSVSPNPVSEKVSITYTKAIERVSVTSITGQVIKEENYSKGKMNPSMSLSGIVAGIYTLRVTDIEGKTGTKKIVKE